MSILNKGHSDQYLIDYKDGNIKEGLGIGTPLDNFFRYKQGNYNILLGHDGIGKTDWKIWYYLVLATQYDIKTCVCALENHSGQLMRKLIQWYTGCEFRSLEKFKIDQAKEIISSWFMFVDNEKEGGYTPEEVLTLMAKTNAQNCFIDPVTGLNRDFSYQGIYEVNHLFRRFTKSTGKTLTISAHPVTGSGRSTGIYKEGHMYAGHLKPPYKGDIEGGKPWLNRVDDMMIAHRLTSHDSLKYFTQIQTVKIKDMDTGGGYTKEDDPLMFDYNNGLGFTIGGIDPINRELIRSQAMKPNDMFDKPNSLNGFTILE